MEKRMTLAQLKRDANSGCLVLEMMERFGDTGEQIPERLRGKRPVTRSNSIGIFLRNMSGEESELRLCNAKLTEYTGDELVIYGAGYRDVTPQEQAVLDGIKRILAERADEYNGGFWQAKQFAMESDCPWMWVYGTGAINGKRYDLCSGRVLDHAVRGDVAIRYKVYREEAQNGKAV